MLSRTGAGRHCFTHLAGSYVLLISLHPFGGATRSLVVVSKTLAPRHSLSSELLFDNAAYNELLLLATKRKSLVHGKLIHAHMIKMGFRPCIFVENNLLNMYCKCGDMGTAHLLFEGIPKKNVVSWNLLISGYSQMGPYSQTLDMFVKMRNEAVEPDQFAYTSALSVCAKTGNSKIGKVIHGMIEVKNFSHVLVTNSLIDMYAKCSSVDAATLVFVGTDILDEVSWNSLISGYNQVGLADESLKIFLQMHQGKVRINSFALGSIFKACSSCNYFCKFGAAVHGCVIKIGLEMDVVVGASMIDMYVKHGALGKAIKIFELMPERNVVVYNAMISGLSGSGIETIDESLCVLSLLSDMEHKGIKPSKFTFSSVLSACNMIGALDLGKQIHAKVVKHNLQKDEFIGSGLIDLYSNFGLIEDGLKCFHSTSKQDVVSWTSMISGFVHGELYEGACSLFYALLVTGLIPDEFTLSSVMSACANLSTIRTGEQIHSYIVKTGLSKFVVCANSQIFLYAKSGDIEAAGRTFAETCQTDVITWSAMIFCYAQHGYAKLALSLFKKMENRGFTPNSITFLGILTACSHGGLLDEGLMHFDSMQRDFNLKPNVKHSACVVDLLGRAGRLSDAEDFIVNSGFDYDPVIWKALLGSCRLYGDIHRGTRVAEKIMELDPQESASYVLLYNLYLDYGEESLADNIRAQMKDQGVKKEPGLSWIEVGSTVHSFVASDKSHPQTQKIYEKLEAMIGKIHELYALNTRTTKTDGSITPETNSYFHSERLAVAFGILALPKSAPIRVMKNLRICRDCHTVMKLFSDGERREIILRDPFRFHWFAAGSCSCGDYW